MKILSVLLFAIFNLCLINAAPGKQQSNGDFYYWITGNGSGKCSIYGLDKNLKNAEEIIIPDSFYLEGKKYYVTEIMHGAFANEKFKKVIFNPSSKNVKLEDSSFLNCKNLREVVFHHGNIEINSNAFTGCKDVDFDGAGIPAIVEKLARDLLKQWKLPIGYAHYNEASTSSRNKKMTDLYALAKKIHENFDRFHWSNAGFNLPAVFIFHSGSVRGIHMAYRELARVMGVDAKYFLNASDAITTSWSYIRFDYDKWYDTWYNVDIYNYDYSKYTGNTYPSNFFMTNSKFIDHLVNEVNTALPYENKKRPDRWYVFTAIYGTNYEGQQYTKLLIDDYIKQNNLGGDRA